MLSNLAVVYEREGRNNDAEQQLKRSLEISERIFDPSSRVVSQSLNSLAELYRLEARFADALPLVNRTISLNVASRDIALGVLYGAQTDGLAAPNEALETSYQVEQRFRSSAAGKAVTTLAARFAAGTDELAQLVRKDQDIAAEAERLNRSIVGAVSKAPVERNAAAEAQMRKRVEEIKSQRDKLEDIFKQRFPDYVALSNPQPLSVSETQALLADDEALVAFDIGARSYVWAITKVRAGWKQLPISAAEVAKEVTALRAALNPEGFKPFDANLAYLLDKQILEPIEDLISGKTRLSFVVDGALTSLPPQVRIARDPAGKDLASVDWLIREHSITVLPSIASLKVLRTKGGTLAGLKPMIGFGDPVFHRTARNEARQKVANSTEAWPASIAAERLPTPSRLLRRYPHYPRLPMNCVRLRNNSERRLKISGLERRLTSRMSNLRRWTSIELLISRPTRWSQVRSKGLPRLRLNLRSFSRFLQSPQKVMTACCGPATLHCSK